MTQGGKRNATLKRTGPWVALDCAIFRNPRIEQLERPTSVLAYVAALCHCADDLTDGHVRPKAMRRLLVEVNAGELDVQALEDAGLIEPAGDGWTVPAFLDWNHPRSWWLRQREADARRQARRMARLREGGQPMTTDDSERTESTPVQDAADPLDNLVHALDHLRADVESA